MKEGIYTCDYANTNNKFAFGGGEGVVYIMSLNDTSNNWLVGWLILSIYL